MGMYDGMFNRQNFGAMPQPQPGIQWVQGESGAKSWFMPPSSTALLMDADQERFYIKSTDASGMPSMRIFEYKEVTPSQSQSVANGPVMAQDNKYCTREELAQITAKCDALEDMVKELVKPKKTVKKEAENE